MQAPISQAAGRAEKTKNESSAGRSTISKVGCVSDPHAAGYASLRTCRPFALSFFSSPTKKAHPFDSPHEIQWCFFLFLCEIACFDVSSIPHLHCWAKMMTKTRAWSQKIKQKREIEKETRETKDGQGRESRRTLQMYWWDRPPLLHSYAFLIHLGDWNTEPVHLLLSFEEAAEVTKMQSGVFAERGAMWQEKKRKKKRWEQLTVNGTRK